MAHIIEAAHRETVTEHAYHFDSIEHPGSGYSFDATPEGALLVKTPLHGESLLTARRLVLEGKMREVGHRTYEHSYWVEATLRCDCGSDVILYDPLYNECERCHQGYNLSGQKLAPVAQWELEDQAALYGPDPEYYREAY